MKLSHFSNVIRRIRVRSGGGGGRRHEKKKTQETHYCNCLKHFAKGVIMPRMFFNIYGNFKTSFLAIRRVASQSNSLISIPTIMVSLRMGGGGGGKKTFGHVLIVFISAIFACHLQAHIL